MPSRPSVMVQTVRVQQTAESKEAVVQPARLPDGQSDGRPDRGAVAVEFALLLPLLAMFLFGIMQYGYGLFQYQAFTSAMSDASHRVAMGVSSCTYLNNAVNSAVTDNGLDAGAVSGVKVKWLATSGVGTLVPSVMPLRSGTAEVTATFRPLNIGIPLVPFPSQFTRTQPVVISNVDPLQATLNPACLG